VTISDERQARVREMLSRRLGSVVVILEAVHRRHNASAILRSCECFGVHEVHLVTKGFKPSKGAARGSERWLDIHRWENTDDAVSALRARGFGVYIADLMEGAHSPDTLPVDGNIAILMGAELTGVSDRARELCDGAICVPMHGLTESLNVSVAAACILQRLTERVRQDSGGGNLASERQKQFFAEWSERELTAKQGMLARARMGS
jgi:tRNA (guanosine-2'-O-)-methyltransferase